MKMTKKWLLAAAALALVFNFASCKSEDDDDDSISGSKIEVDNTDSEGAYYTKTKRAYTSTRLKHLGALVGLELREQTASSKDGVVGVMWDLKKSSKAKSKVVEDVEDTVGELAEGATTLAVADAINFFILGFRNNSGKLEYYISKFYNITDVNGPNFGAGEENANGTVTVDGYQVTTDALGLTATEPRELVVDDFTDLGTANIVKENDTDTTGTIYVWADIYPAYTTGLLSTRKNYGLKYEKYTVEDAGKYVVDIYVGKDKPTKETTEDSEGTKFVKTVVIDTEKTGYTSAKMGQAKAARYGNAYAGKKMSGYVKYQKTYAEDEVVEE